MNLISFCPACHYQADSEHYPFTYCTECGHENMHECELIETLPIQDVEEFEPATIAEYNDIIFGEVE